MFGSVVVHLGLKGGVGALRALPTRSREIDTAFIMKLAVAMDLFWRLA
jgi:hypothetical protein